MADISCPLPEQLTAADAGRAYRQARQRLSGLGPEAYKREAARALGIDHDHYNMLYKQAIGKKAAKPTRPSPVSKPPARAASAPKVKPAKSIDWTRDSDVLAQQMQAAEAQRVALEKARYIQSGKGKGTLNPKNGYTPERASARQNYTEIMNTEMNALKRDPAAYAAKNKSAVKYVAEQNRLVEELLQKNALTEDITVARAMAGDFSNLKAGQYMADPGFLSTTTDLQAFISDSSAAYRAGIEAGKQSWTFIIQVPKGTHALPGAGFQKEIFFGPGTKQRIVQIDRSTHTVYTQVVK